ncbi:MAG: hypothetical protein FJZ56_00500 [Chlamydiae bacterium]|nr:hypothetical protein [Chlamydiota bacterium]
MISKKQAASFIEFKGSLLGDVEFLSSSFPEIEEVFALFHLPEFRDLPIFQKHDRVSKKLCELIAEHSTPCFLLPAVVDYISRVQLLLPTYNFVSFEFWLNQYSGLSFEENFKIRGKIAGKYLQRDDYQTYFPIGLDKQHPGSHFVLAHFSPDIDTTVASYWGFVDAFAAKVAEGLHHWIVPERLPDNPIEMDLLFHRIFGSNTFQVLASLRRGIRVTALDLMTQKGIVKKTLGEKSYGIEHERSSHAVILVDDAGNYLGDWRAVDLDTVRGLIYVFNEYLRHVESFIHQKLIAIFAKSNLTKKDVETELKEILSRCLTDYEMNDANCFYIDAFMKEVLLIEAGESATFDQFAKGVSAFGLDGFNKFKKELESLHSSTIFDQKGLIIENRPQIFALLDKILFSLTEAFSEFRRYVDTLGCALDIKRKVFEHNPHYLSHQTELSDIQEQMKNYSHMTVNYREPTGKYSVMGAVYASTLQKSVLGTASLRDFGNFDEAEIPSYITPISLLDHHRVDMKTPKAARFVISDVQSCNVIVADLAMKINDRYSDHLMSKELIEKELQEEMKKKATASTLRVMQRLLLRKSLINENSPYFVSIEREFVEYLHFLYAILDDTDFLTKTTLLDVECVASLVNRLKSLFSKKEVEVIHFDDIARDGDFVKNATKKLQKNEDLYSLYHKVYKGKELLIEKTIEELDNALFQDTKTQNGCASVGQFKIYCPNIPTLERHRNRIYSLFVQRAEEIYRKDEKIDMHLFMVTTLISAEELHLGKSDRYEHKDVLCCWYPQESKKGALHLKYFLQEFFALSSMKDMDIEVSVYGPRREEFRRLVEGAAKRPLIKIEEFAKEKASLLVIKVDPTSINSRKAKITPCLPWN